MRISLKIIIDVQKLFAYQYILEFTKEIIRKKFKYPFIDHTSAIYALFNENNHVDNFFLIRR